MPTGLEKVFVNLKSTSIKIAEVNVIKIFMRKKEISSMIGFP